MAVIAWGTGRPDFSETTFPARTEVETTRQTAWTDRASLTVSPPTTRSRASVYTVPTGQKLILGYIKITLSIDHILLFALLVDGNVYDRFYTSSAVMPIPDTAPYIFDAGEIIGYQINSNLDVPFDTRISLSGFIHDV